LLIDLTKRQHRNGKVWTGGANFNIYKIGMLNLNMGGIHLLLGSSKGKATLRIMRRPSEEIGPDKSLLFTGEQSLRVGG